MNYFDLANFLQVFKKIVNQWYVLIIILCGSYFAHYLLRSEETQNSNVDVVDVIIIGAGFSGIGAAKSLYENDIKNILVLEAKNYIGGRVHKVEFDGIQIPLGAGWIHRVEQNPLLWRLANENNFDYYEDNYDDLTYRDIGVTKDASDIEFRVASERLERLLQKEVKKKMVNKKTDISLAEGLRLCGWQAKNKMEKAIEYLKLDFENGNPASLLSAFDFPYTGEGQDVLVTDVRGFEYIAQVLSRPFQEKVYLNHDVSSIRKDGDVYTIKTFDGRIYKSHYVLVSFSNTVLQSKRVEFVPPLPKEKFDAFDRILTGDYCKIIFLFPVKFWEDSNYIIIGQNNKRFVHWQNLHRVFPGKNILLATLTGADCKNSQMQTDNEIMREAVETLRGIYGNVPSPIDMVRTNWSFDPHVLGAYSNPTIGTKREHYETMRTPVNAETMWFTGEHVAVKSGYVHGALEQGIQSGMSLAQFIKMKRNMEVT